MGTEGMEWKGQDAQALSNLPVLSAERMKPEPILCPVPDTGPSP